MTTIILSLNIDIPFGVNVLRNDCRSALAIAHATGGTFIRCNVLSGVMVTDQGIIEGKAPQIVRYRNILETGPPPSIKILADIHVKYASPLVEKSIEYTARNTVFRGMADGLIVTGSETGDPPRISDLRAVKNAVPDRPLFAGSGVTAENVESVLEFADGCIVGTAFKKNSKMGNPIEKERIKSFMKKVEKLR
jgi:membrane complex biogenesis BtpA family protein